MPHLGPLIFTALAARHTPGVYMEEYSSVQFSSDSVFEIFEKGTYVPSDLKNKIHARFGTLPDLIFLRAAWASIVGYYDVVDLCRRWLWRCRP